MTLSKKHFTELARIAGLIECDHTRAIIVSELAEWCGRENPNFDYARFAEVIRRATLHTTGCLGPSRPSHKGN